MTWPRLVGRLLLGSLFVHASLDKIQHPRLFAEAIIGYDIFPSSVVPSLALLIPWLEFISGLFLLVGLLSRGSALIIFIMSSSFSALLLNSLVRGLKIGCGCFVESPWAVGSWSHFAFDIVLTIIAACLYQWGVGPLSLDVVILRATTTEGQSNPCEDSQVHRRG